MFLAYLLYSSDESDDELLMAAMNVVNTTKVIPKISNYAETTVAQFDDEDLKSHFRLSRQTFHHLLHKTGAMLFGGEASDSGWMRITPDK